MPFQPISRPENSFNTEELALPWQPKQQRRHRRKQKKNENHDYVDYVKYGFGIAAGITVVGWIKRKIQSIPVVGVLTTPFLCLMPTMLLGTAVGAAVVYGINEGDPMAAQKKVQQQLPKMKRHLKTAQSEVANAASDIQRSLKDIHSQHLAAAEMAAREGQMAMSRFASQLEAAAADAEHTLAPAVERHVTLAKRQLDRHTAEYDHWVQQHSSRNSRLLAVGSSSDG